MSDKTRKNICLVSGVLALFAILILAFSVLKNYSHSTIIITGPYKKTLFVILGLILAASIGFYFRKADARTLTGMICIGAGVLWFSGRMIVAYRSPDHPSLPLIDQLMPIPLILIGIGAALWFAAFANRSFPRPAISEKQKLILVLLLMFICLQTVLDGGFNWDDAFFSVEAQAMRVSGESIFRRVWKEITEYVRIGRINPFATFHFLVFYFIPDVRVYKLLLVVLSLLNGFLYYRFLSRWGNNSSFGLLVLLAVPLCFQLRLYHDPLNSYYGLMQVMFCELMLALIFFIRWLREKKTRYLILSLIPFVMGLMSYEMFFPLTALFLIPALTHEKKLLPAVRAILPYVILAVLLFGLSMVLRTNITEETAYNGTAFSLEPGKILQTLACQTGAAFPLSYRTAGNDAAIFGRLIQWKTIFNTSLSVFLTSIRWQDLLACLILVLIICTSAPKQARFSWPAAIFGLLLWLLPGLVISLSWKYQQELQPGLAYIPVYFSCYGAALILYELAMLIGKAFSSRTKKALLCGIGCVVLLISLQDNRRISEMLNDIFLYPRQAGETALKAGILAENEETVVSDVPYSLWEHGWQLEPYQSQFYSLNTGYPVHALSTTDFTESYIAKKIRYINPSHVTLVTYSGDKNGSFAKSGRLRGAGIDRKTGQLKNPLVSDLFFFVSGKNMNGTVLIYETQDGETIWLPLSEAWLIRETDQGTLYKLQESRRVNFDSFGILVN